LNIKYYDVELQSFFNVSDTIHFEFTCWIPPLVDIKKRTEAYQTQSVLDALYVLSRS